MCYEFYYLNLQKIISREDFLLPESCDLGKTRSNEIK